MLFKNLMEAHRMLHWTDWLHRFYEKGFVQKSCIKNLPLSHKSYLSEESGWVECLLGKFWTEMPPRGHQFLTDNEAHTQLYAYTIRLFQSPSHKWGLMDFRSIYFQGYFLKGKFRSRVYKRVTVAFLRVLWQKNNSVFTIWICFTSKAYKKVWHHLSSF